jgi:hypothetical protein
MPVPSLITELSPTASLNSPPGGEDVFPNLDNYLRALASFIAQLRQARADDFPVRYQLAGSDLTTNLANTALAGSFHVQADFTALEVSASLDTVSTSGLVTIDVRVGGVSRLSTLLTIDANEATSYTAAVPAVFSNPVFTKGQVVVFSITTAGTGAKGLKLGIRGV